MSIEDWSLLRVILAVSRHQGLTGAATELGVNQGTVSRQLAKAEASVGARLFDRLNSGLQPTLAGHAAIEAAERVEASMSALNVALAGLDKGMSGTLRLSIPTSLMDYALADDLGEFCHDYPDIRLEITSSDGIVSVGERKADVVIRAQDRPAAGLWGRQIATIEYQFYGSKALHEEWSDALLNADETARMPIVESMGTPPAIINEFRKVYPAAQTVVRCNGPDVFIPLLRRGVGFCLSPCFIANTFPELAMVSRARTSRKKSLWVLTHPDLRDTPRFRLMIDFLTERLAARGALFATPLE